MGGSSSRAVQMRGVHACVVDDGAGITQTCSTSYGMQHTACKAKAKAAGQAHPATQAGCCPQPFWVGAAPPALTRAP